MAAMAIVSFKETIEDRKPEKYMYCKCIVIVFRKGTKFSVQCCMSRYNAGIK